MKKSPLFIAAACIALSIFSSCRKVCDFLRDHPDAHDSLCQVTALTFNGGYRYDITYNAKGDPVTMFNNTPSGPMLNLYFRYDARGRLSDYMGAYPGNFGAIVWNKYAYIRPGYITDTAIYYGPGDVRGPAPDAKDAFDYYINAYTLDGRGRIIKTWSIPIDPPHTPVLTAEFHYDANGNLPLPSTDLSYDDKVNPYRTNWVWQFIYQDYSRNNAVKIDYFYFTNYNSFGLPLNLRNLQSYNIYTFGIQNDGPDMDISYACAMPKGPVGY
jgi:hypothetical protein